MPTSPDHDPESPHAFLRRESAPWHAAVEEAFAGFDLQSRPGLAAFLTAQARAVLALETALAHSGVEQVWPHWARRRRHALLHADLRRLGCSLPAAAVPPVLSTPGHSLGALYVLEGSRLGGKLLARRVRASPDPAVRQAASFLEGEPEAQAWAVFRATLDRAPVDRSHLLEGARRAFACFVAAARVAEPEPTLPARAEALLPTRHQHDKFP